MNKLIKKKYELSKRAKLLKTISRKIRKRNKLRSKFNKQDLIVSKLLEEYQKRYLY